MGDPTDDTHDAFIGGVIEGFYGRPWSEEQRTELFGRMPRWGLDTYVYAPKDDLKHRAVWREPYDARELERLRALVEAAAGAGVRFVYAIAPGLDVRFADPDDERALAAKVDQVLALGAPWVALLFDDVPRALAPADEERFGTLAAAQSALANRVRAQVAGRGGRLLFCPTDYCERMARPSLKESAYLAELGERLEPDVLVLWTGPEVISERITPEHAREVGAVLRRRPLVWDNLHANDYDLRRVYLGPYAGRPPELREHVAGVLSNPNVEYAANTVPLATLGAWIRQDGYEPRAACLEATRAWHEGFALAAGTPVTPDDLTFVADFHYLPFEHGPAATALLEDLAYLRATPPAAWDDTFARVAGTVGRLASLAGRLASLRDRDLLYGLHPYVTDVLMEAGRAAALLDAVRRGGAGEAPRDGVANTYGGGVTSELRRMFPVEPNGAPGPAADTAEAEARG